MTSSSVTFSAFARACARAALAALLTAGVVAGFAGPALAQPADDPPPPPAEEAPPPPPPAEAAPAPEAPPPEAAPPSLAPTPAPEAAAAPAADATFDLSSLVQEDASGGGGGGSENALQIYGFADASFVVPVYDEDNVWASYLPGRTTFAAGSLNLYLAKKVSERCRSLAEVRFLYEPHGSVVAGQRVDHTVGDHANRGRNIYWSGISMERLHADCDLAPWLTVRLGQWFTPYGIWNIDHGSPTIIAIRRPYIVNDQLFPESQTGLQLFGSRGTGDFQFGYTLTLSNGRGSAPLTEDLDQNKALGARLEVAYSGLGMLKLGGSWYRGRLTNAGAPVLNYMTSKTVLTPTLQYDEQSFAGDLSWDWEGLALRSEFLFNERAYTDVGRPRANGVFTPDGKRWGTYNLVGYRLPWLGIMPYGMIQLYEIMQAPGRFAEHLLIFHVGVNVLLSPAMVLKAEYLHLKSEKPVLAALNNYRNLEIMLTWAF